MERSIYMKQNNGQTAKRNPVRLRCDAETLTLIQQFAAVEKITKSEAIRRLIHAGVHEMEVRKDPAAYEGELQAQLQAAVQAAIKPSVERLAAISAKAAQIAGAAFFMTVYTQSREFPYNITPELAVNAHKLGVEYLSMKGPDLEEAVKELMDHGQ